MWKSISRNQFDPQKEEMSSLTVFEAHDLLTTGHRTIAHPLTLRWHVWNPLCCLCVLTDICSCPPRPHQSLGWRQESQVPSSFSGPQPAPLSRLAADNCPHTMWQSSPLLSCTRCLHHHTTAKSSEDGSAVHGVERERELFPVLPQFCWPLLTSPPLPAALKWSKHVSSWSSLTAWDLENVFCLNSQRPKIIQFKMR